MKRKAVDSNNYTANIISQLVADTESGSRAMNEIGQQA
jgi:hypothetical protein